VQVRDLSHDGRGVAELGGKVLFVWGALPGETVRVTRVRTRNRFDEADILELVETSPDRQDPFCEVFGRCGGCAMQHMTPAAQLRAKQATLISNLTRIGEVSPATVLEPLTGPDDHYRRRARLSVRHVPGKGRVMVGFRERSAPYVTQMDRCPVLDRRVSELPGQLATLFMGLALRDEIAQVELAVGDDAVALVLRVREEPGASDREALLRFAAEREVVIYLQTGGLDSIRPLAGSAELSYALPAYDARIEFLPTDFVQVNAALNRAMVDQALTLLEVTAEHRVLELFSGLGNFTLPLARRAREVLAVEGEEGLVARARSNAANCGLSNIVHEVADLAAPGEAPRWAQGGFDRVLIDPPRIGAREVLGLIAASGASRLVYVSCHPGSLARDAGELVRDHGFRLAAAGVMDMFPSTAHVESIALFTR